MALRDSLDTVERRGRSAIGLLTGGYRALRNQAKRVLPVTLLGRSLLIIVLPLIILQAISTWAFYDRHLETMTRRLTQSIAFEVSLVIGLMERRDGVEEWVDIVALANDHLGFRLQLLDTDRLRDPPRGFLPSIVEERLERAMREEVDHPFVIDVRTPNQPVEIQVLLGDKILQVHVPRHRMFSARTGVFLSWMVGSSIVLIVFATLFMRQQIRPIRRLARAAENFGKGIDIPQFRPGGAIEVRQAGAAFLQMRDRIRRQIDQRTAMLAGVSHDLRTPLTRMKLELAMLGKSPEVESLMTDVTQMEKMVEGYLAFARGEGMEVPHQLDLAELIDTVVGQARREGANIALHRERTLPFVGRREALRRCIGNLINNAQRYGGSVVVTAASSKGGIEILIEDDGPGISPEKREEVFRPFHRLESSRNPATGGTGLGLTIARDVVRGHGGELTLHDAPGGGLRARIWLPV